MKEIDRYSEDGGITVRLAQQLSQREPVTKRNGPSTKSYSNQKTPNDPPYGTVQCDGTVLKKVNK